MRRTWGNVIGEGIEVILEVRNVAPILLQNLIAVSEELLKRHCREWHGLQNVEIIAGGGYSPINAMNEGCWSRIWELKDGIIREIGADSAAIK